ncbi:F-box domain-containing protein [Orpheovirus IHUMI-LCC2]|uniref:F-box domain-containing protein n=1 Tax=Orpheovirus IHUMI-LCC2 TaxID=2023057 RepID=A0A2I2L3P7_9VIRU|nr:F-box domain-containing protein [Orpheovirus IHUMI-LCC2]SNW62099.1 F-box domain-containing protein [Orpheovirus IHUMI-LCC2]
MDLISLLPNDMHYNIIKNLEYKDIYNFSSCNKNLYNINSNNYFWYNKIYKDFNINQDTAICNFKRYLYVLDRIIVIKLLQKIKIFVTNIIYYNMEFFDIDIYNIFIFYTNINEKQKYIFDEILLATYSEYRIIYTNYSLINILKDIACSKKCVREYNNRILSTCDFFIDNIL